MGENVDGGRKRKIYIGDGLSLSSARGDSVFLLMLERERVSPMYILLFLASSTFSFICFKGKTYPSPVFRME